MQSTSETFGETSWLWGPPPLDRNAISSFTFNHVAADAAQPKPSSSIIEPKPMTTRPSLSIIVPEPMPISGDLPDAGLSALWVDPTAEPAAGDTVPKKRRRVSVSERPTLASTVLLWSQFSNAPFGLNHP
jgi:hypothetical protein